MKGFFTKYYFAEFTVVVLKPVTLAQVVGLSPVSVICSSQKWENLCHLAEF